MENLDKLHTDYLKVKAESEQATLDFHKKQEEVSELKQQIDDTKVRVVEIERFLNNAKKGIGVSLSTEEFLSLKKELPDKKIMLGDMQDLLFAQNNALKMMSSDRSSLSRRVNTLKEEITEIIATQAAIEIAEIANDKLRLMINMILANMNFLGRGIEFRDVLSGQIGNKLCQQLFAVNGSSSGIELPQTGEAISARDSLIDAL